MYEIPIGSCEKAKVPFTAQPTSARSIYSWSRVIDIWRYLFWLKWQGNKLC